MSYKYRSVERRHRDGYYSCKLKQLNDLWQQFCDLNKEVQQAAIPTESEYSSRLVALRELVEKYQKIFLDNIPWKDWAWVSSPLVNLVKGVC